MTIQKFDIIRKCLETTYNNVVFVNSVDLKNVWGNTVSTTTYWKVGMFETALSITFSDDGMVYATSQNCAVSENGLGMNEFIKEKLFGQKQKKQNEKVENTMENTKKLAGIELNVLRNGVKVLENGIENDFELAQKILDVNIHTQNIDAETAYNKRDYTFYEGSYKVKIQRNKEHSEFLKLIDNEKCINKNYNEVAEKYRNNEIEFSEFREIRNSQMDCDCNICKAHVPSFDEWKNGVIEYEEYNEFTQSNRVKQMKLGKYLKKQGFDNSIIDFYSAQIKDEKDVYITITSAPQFIVGMSYFAKMDSWDGYNGTSCMDVRHGGSYPKRLAGALYDNKLHIAMLHESMDDLKDMSNKLLARVLMRPLEVNDKIVLVPTRYYGNNVTKNNLHYALNQLNEVSIFSLDVADREKAENNDSFDWITESIDGGYEITATTEVNVYDTIDVDVSYECPACNGYGEISQEIDVNGYEREVTFECPLCNGTGEYEETITVQYDEYVDVEFEEMVYTYADDEGSHYELNDYNDSYEMRINIDMIERLSKVEEEEFIEEEVLEV